MQMIEKRYSQKVPLSGVGRILRELWQLEVDCTAVCRITATQKR